MSLGIRALALGGWGSLTSHLPALPTLLPAPAIQRHWGPSMGRRPGSVSACPTATASLLEGLLRRAAGGHPRWCMRMLPEAKGGRGGFAGHMHACLNLSQPATGSLHWQASPLPLTELRHPAPVLSAAATALEACAKRPASRTASQQTTPASGKAPPVGSLQRGAARLPNISPTSINATPLMPPLAELSLTYFAHSFPRAFSCSEYLDQGLCKCVPCELGPSQAAAGACACMRLAKHHACSLW